MTTTPTAPEPRISEALRARLLQLSLSPTLPIAWPDVPLTRPADVYIRVSEMRSPTGSLTIGRPGRSIHQGIFQVDVEAPLGSGDVSVTETAGLIADHFQAQWRLPVSGGGEVRIPDRPDVVTMKTPDQTRWMASVSVNWTSIL